MKNTIFLFLFFCLTLSASAQIGLRKEAGIYKAGTEYLEAYQRPITLHRGDVVEVMADSFYLVNPIQYAFYKRLEKYLVERHQADLTGEVIHLYETNLNEQERAFQQWYNYQSDFEQKMTAYLHAASENNARTEASYEEIQALARALEAKVDAYGSSVNKELKKQGALVKIGKFTLKVIPAAAVGYLLAKKF